ncbi:MAG TPA: NADH-quinone oxidoreductase subunit A [Oligoflexia bacterium]|nr:NADH-quinone oxidoreductase subunit A [Oligoflexia bacterium]HMP27470.1 NADH-quinone oxidoreductase subunit A [Oligoflexia bacterium]
MYQLFLLLFACSSVIAFLIGLASWLGPKNPTPTKQIPFECGANPVGSPNQQRFNVRFYLVAMIFILFDIEVVFLYPWALVVHQLGPLVFFAMLSFIIILTTGLVYVWRLKILNWNE